MFINNPFFYKKNIIVNRINKLHFINMNYNNTKIYNPIIGSNLGIPLNLLQYVYTTSHYGENIIDYKYILLQFSIGIFTYGTDRFLDALEYNTNKDLNNTYNLEKINYYEYLLENFNLNILVILTSYLYTISLLINNIENYPFILLLTSTLNYKNFKKNFGQFKALYIGIFWTCGTFLLPCVLHDNNYEVLNDPYIYLPSILSMFGSSNLLDLKDVYEDKKENILTIPVLYGKKNTIAISHLSIVVAMLIFYFNKNFYNNIYISLLFEIQNFANLFLNYNITEYVN
tara:strand:+ start:661 stop:1518 length:858 start_codon:yes stop_codon:yes gene_type:complete